MAAFDGAALGAIADSARAARQTGLAGRSLRIKERAIGVQEDQLEQNAERAAQKRADAIEKGAVAGAEAIRAALAGGKPAEAVESLAAQVRFQIEKINDPAKVAKLNQLLERSLQTPSTVISDAEGAGQAAAAQSVAQRDALVGAGVDPGVAAGAANLDRAPDPSLVRLQRARDDAIAAGKTDDAKEIQRQIDKLGTVTGRTEFDRGETVGVTGDKTAKRNLAGAFRSASSNIREIDIALGKLRDTPGSVGIPGFIEQEIGGLLRQIPGIGDAAQATGLVNTPEEAKAVADARAQATALALNLVQTVIDEPRTSDFERQRAEALSRQLEAGADFPVIEQALTTTQEFFKRRATDSAVQLMFELGLTPADLSDEANAEKLFNQFIQQGLSQDQALDQFIEVKRRVGG